MTRSELKQYIDDALEIALSECTSDNPLEAVSYTHLDVYKRQG